MAMPSEPVLSGILRQDRLTGIGGIARAGSDACAEGLHDGAAVRLLLVTDANHINDAFHVEETASLRECRAPLARARFGRQSSDAFLFVVVGLRRGGVQLMAAGRRNALVLVIDMRWCIERLFQPARPQQRRWAP